MKKRIVPELYKHSLSLFTLIELMVVIGIIGILVSLSMASISLVKDKAKEVNCLANERGVSLSVYGFSGDHDGRIKPSFKKQAVLDIGTVYGNYVDNADCFNCPARKNDDSCLYIAFNDDIAMCQYAIFSPFHYYDAFVLGGEEYSPSDIRLVGEAIPPEQGYYWLADITCPWFSSAEYRHANKRRMNVIFGDGSAASEKWIPPPVSESPGIPPYFR